MLKLDWLREYETPLFTEASDQVVQSWDTALTANETSKFSVCLTFRVRNNNEYYLVDVFREKLEFPALVQQVIHLASVRFRGGAAKHDDIVAQPPQGARQRDGIRIRRQVGDPLALCLRGDFRELAHRFADTRPAAAGSAARTLDLRIPR